jgi:hypothetical protein
VASSNQVDKSQLHGTTGSGNVLPISALTQENSTSLLFTRQGREDFASSTHPRIRLTHNVEGSTISYQARQLPLLCGLEDVVAQTGFLITADSSNTITIMIGGKSVSATNGIPLVAGQSIFIDIVRFSKFYAMAATDHAGETANLFWLDM